MGYLENDEEGFEELDLDEEDFEDLEDEIGEWDDGYLGDEWEY